MHRQRRALHTGYRQLGWQAFSLGMAVTSCPMAVEVRPPSTALEHVLRTARPDTEIQTRAPSGQFALTPVFAVRWFTIVLVSGGRARLPVSAAMPVVWHGEATL